MPTVVLDNGAYDIKLGYAGASVVQQSNSISRSRDRRTYLGNQVHTRCRDYSGLVYRRPVEKGMLVNWEAERSIWDYCFYGRDSDSRLEPMLQPEESCLIYTEKPLTLPALSTNTDQIVFEEYGFGSYLRCSSASLVPWNDVRSLFLKQEASDAVSETTSSERSSLSECTLVVDCGYSATHVMPIILGEVYSPAIKRLSVGGKMLTNYLKETVSFRHYNMMEETYLINRIKESLCYVSPQFSRDIEACHLDPKPFRAHYLLPDFKTTRTGRTLTADEAQAIAKARTGRQDDQQVLALTNERFTIPEALFDASTLGLNESSLPQAIVQCMRNIPAEIQSMLLANIVLVGGTANLPGLRDRLMAELKFMAPQNSVVRVVVPEDPSTYAWAGGSALAENTEALESMVVTKQEYEEHGQNLCMSRFASKIKV